MAHERGITTMAGGQSAMAFGEELLADDSPCDFLFTGDGEEVVPSVLAQIREGRQPQAATGVSPRGATAPAPPAICSDVSFTAELEYELYPGWRSFFPLVEESRACPFNCAFCSNAPLTERRWRGKDPKIVLREVERVCRMWNRTDATPVVLQCANFGTDAAQAEELLAAVVRSPVNPRFLAALRVDSHWKKYLHLVGSTFDQVHFGLESGSPQQLLAMGKAKSPATYLDMAGEAFAAFHERGVHVGINFLLGYFGETYRTLGETFGFILRHSSAIDSAWGGPFVLYPDTPAWSQLPEFSEKCGSRTVETSSMCRRIRTYPVQPSQHLRHEDVAAASLLLMRMVNSRRGYYEHYRWYLGPDPSTDADFYSEERFFDLMFAHADPATLGVSLTP
jgi:anaerobic magnesium-protoporphyrin IX monomethyl ester cyclase